MFFPRAVSGVVGCPPCRNAGCSDRECRVVSSSYDQRSPRSVLGHTFERLARVKRNTVARQVSAKLGSVASGAGRLRCDVRDSEWRGVGVKVVSGEYESVEFQSRRPAFMFDRAVSSPVESSP